MSSKLRDLIRAVRSCKTAAEERAVLQRESALVRQQLAAGNNRGTCMLKMMYMTMLGYATEFGQMEVIKLLAEPDFASKRIGYLTLCVLMDEHQEVLTLAENHMKRDLVSTSNPFVQGLALDTIANIAGEDMSRDMMNEVLTLCNSTNTTLKKKAALAAQRAVRKAPELVDVFLEDERLMSIFSERNHGVLVCNLALLNECLASPNGRPFLKRYAALIPGAVRHLSALVLSAFANEYEVGGVADPFLQVKLLTFLRIVGSDSEEAAESMNNVLAQTATNTSMDKNVGSSVLYECVKTILAIQCDESLRMLAYNILGRFMDRDNNCRFVALSTFLDVVQVDKTVAQRHRTTVLDCLKDVDTSIRRRALQLTVALVDETNVRLMAADLLAYLAVCTEELKEETSEQLCRVIEQRSPNDEWRVEMSIKLFRNLHAKVPMSFAVNFIGLITRADADLQQRCAKTLWDELNTAAQDQASLKSRTSFLAAAIWVAGEFSQHLASNAAASDNLVGTLGTLVADVSAPEVKQYAVNAVMKIAARFPSASPLARSIFEGCATSMNVELQQRAAEYIELLQLEAELIAFAFSPGGTISVETQSEAEALRFSLPTGDATSTLQSASAKTPAPPPKEKSGIDLDSLFDSVPKADPPRGSGAPPPTQTNPPPPVTNLDEFLFGPSPRAPAPAAPRTGGAPSIIGLSPFDPPPTTVVVQQSAPLVAAPVLAPAPVPAPRSPKVIVHEAADLLVSVSAKARPSPNELDVSLFVTSRSLSLTGVLLSIAVTKTQTVELGPTMTDSVQPNGVLEQSMVIHGPGPHTRLAMMVKVSYKVGAQARSTEFKFAKELPLTGN